jgi:hypothetical protein
MEEVNDALASRPADQPGIASDFIVHALEQAAQGGRVRAPAAQPYAAVDAGGHDVGDMRLHGRHQNASGARLF